MSSGSKIKKGFGWDLLGSFFNQLSGLVTTIILARLLGPEEFGLIAMAMVVVAISEVFVEVGFGHGLIQKIKVDNEHFNSVFIFNIFASLLLSLGIFFSAGAIGRFYNSTEVVRVVESLAVLPFIASFGIVHQAILTRNMDFKPLALRITYSSLFGGIVGISAAFLNQGVYSLVWKQIASTLGGTLALWYGSKWIPSFKFNFAKLKDLLAFSQFVFLDSLLMRFFSRLNPIFIGKVFSAEVLGLFSKAESLNLMVSDYTSKSIRKVMFPALSSLQNDGEKFKELFLKTLSISSVSSTFLAGCLYFSSESLILFVLGSDWLKMIPIFKALVFVTLISPHIALNSQSILSMGFSKTKMFMNLIHRSIVILPLIIGYFYGILFFTYFFVIAKFLVLIFYVLFVHYYIKIDFYHQFKEILLSFAPLLFLVILFSVLFFINPIIQTIVFALTYVFYLYVLKHESLSFFRRLFIQVVNRMSKSLLKN